LSALLGVVGGFVGQLLTGVYQEYRIRRTLLRMGYGYVGQLLAALHSLLRGSAEYEAQVAPALELVLPSIPDDYVRAHHDIYSRLDESVVFDVVFSLGRRFADADDRVKYIRVGIETIVLQFLMKRLTEQSLRKYRGADESKTFAEMLSHYEKRVRDRYLKKT
jgi:hypothetical protein